MKTRIVFCAFVAMTLTAAASSPVAAQATNAAVMTRNVYIGADLSAAFDVEDLSEIPAAAGVVLANILASNFPARAELLAQEIARNQPHVVGLQEVFDIQAEVVFGSASAPDIDLDFLEILISKLAAQGQHYSVAVENQNVFAPVPLAIIPGGVGYQGHVRDRDVILVRHNVAWSNPMMGTYPTLIPTPFGFDLVRGWTSVDIVFGGNAFRVVNTHLEVESSGAGCVQTLQAFDLHDALAFLDTTLGVLPQVVIGDFNSDPGDPGCAAIDDLSPYEIMAGSSFTDVWVHRHNDLFATGETWKFESLDASQDPTLTRRVDQIWIRRADASGVTVRLTGDDPKDTTPEGLYASDHLGVAARMTLIPAD